MREAGLGSQKNPRRPVAEELHNGVPFRRYHAQAAPQQYASQHGVFGHPNPGFLNSVHNPRGGGEAERLSRIAAEEEAWHSKLKGDCKYMMSMLKQPEHLSQIDRFGMSMLRDPPRSHYFKTLKGPEGVTHPYPVSMLAQEPWHDPAETAAVTMYGSQLRYESDIDGSDKVCKFKTARAVGVKQDIVRPTLHSNKFGVSKVPPRDSADAVCHRVRFPPLVNGTSAGREPWAPAPAKINPPPRQNAGLWAPSGGPPKQVAGLTPRRPTHDL